MIDRRWVHGTAGVRLHAWATGPPRAPGVLLLPGFAQTSRTWAELMNGRLASELQLVTMDLRGHGLSEKPLDGYVDPRTWAGDIQATIDAFGLVRPVVVAWSYAGLILCDYLRVHGGGGLGGCMFVGASTRINDGGVPTVGKEMLHISRDLLSEDADRRAAAAVAFARRMRNSDIRADLLDVLVEQVETVPLEVRRRLLTRCAVNDDVLRMLRLPTVVAHGTEDPFVLPIMADITSGLVPGARLSTYDGCGHSVFAEDRDRFEAELHELVATAFSASRSWSGSAPRRMRRATTDSLVPRD